MPPLILTGSNVPHFEPNSDAPRNFIDLAKTSRLDLLSGGYWVFNGNLYRASDFVKIDPEESRSIEGQSTFHSPHRTVLPINSLLEFGKIYMGTSRRDGPQSPNHDLRILTMEKLYDALESIYVMDLGNQNPSWTDLKMALDPKIKAIVVATHSLGNTDNETRAVLVEAAKRGKLVLVTSRALIGSTNETYESSLLGANTNPDELAGTGKHIIVSHRLNKTMARALAARGIIGGRDQDQTQALVSTYAISRGLIDDYSRGRVVDAWKNKNQDDLEAFVLGKVPPTA